MAQPEAGTAETHPVGARHVWLYEHDGGIKVELAGSNQAFPRTENSILKRLVYSKNPLNVPLGDPESYYTAQLIHYGMLPVGTVEKAIGAFIAEFEKASNEAEDLKLPVPILLLEDALELEYYMRMEKKEARLAELQKEIDAIEAMKKEEVRLRLELAALKPVTLRTKGQDAQAVGQRAPPEESGDSQETSNFSIGTKRKRMEGSVSGSSDGTKEPSSQTHKPPRYRVQYPQNIQRRLNEVLNETRPGQSQTFPTSSSSE